LTPAFTVSRHKGAFARLAMSAIPPGRRADAARPKPLWIISHGQESDVKTPALAAASMHDRA